MRCCGIPLTLRSIPCLPFELWWLACATGNILGIALWLHNASCSDQHQIFFPLDCVSASGWTGLRQEAKDICPTFSPAVRSHCLQFSKLIALPEVSPMQVSVHNVRLLIRGCRLGSHLLNVRKHAYTHVFAATLKTPLQWIVAPSALRPGWSETWLGSCSAASTGAVCGPSTLAANALN